MKFLLMMRYGNSRDKASFVFNLISQNSKSKSISFPQLVVFYFKIVDEFEQSNDPDILLNENFADYIGKSPEEKEMLLVELEENLKYSISIADIFFNLMEVELNYSIPRKKFLDFMEHYPKAMELLNFIDVNDKDFRNIQNINKHQQYIEGLDKIIDQLRTVIQNQNLHLQANAVGIVSKPSSNNINNMLEKVNKIQQEIEQSFQESILEEKNAPKQISKSLLTKVSIKIPSMNSKVIKPKLNVKLSFEEQENIFKQKMNSAKKLFQSNLFETPVKPIGNVNSKRLTHTLSVFRKKNFVRYDTGEDGVGQETKNLFKKKRETTTNQFIDEILKSNIVLKSQYAKSGLQMETPKLEPYINNINKMHMIGEKRVQPVHLETILKQLLEMQKKIQEDQSKEKDIYFPDKKEETEGPEKMDISTIKSKKEKKKLRKRLKIYDENYCIAMSFVKALNKSLLLLSSDKHEIPTQEDFELENTISLSKLNNDSYDYCEFMDVAPLVFQRIRFFDGIANNDFIKDIGFNDFKAIFMKRMQSLKEEKSTGKSGSVFL